MDWQPNLGRKFDWHRNCLWQEDEEEAKELCNHILSGDLVKLQRRVRPLTVNARVQSRTLLMCAARSSRAAEAATVLLRAGANANLTDSRGCTAMHFAAFENNPALISVLHRHDASLIDTQDGVGNTPAIVAAAVNSDLALRQLMHLNANLKVVNGNSQSAAAAALRHESWSAAFCFFDEIKSPILDASTRQENFPELENFIADWRVNGYLSQMQLWPEQKMLLLRMEAQAQLVCRAAGSGNARLLQRVATRGNCDRRWRSRTPLLHAAERRHPDCGSCTRLLLQLGADPHAGDYLGQTPAHAAAIVGNVETLSLLPQSCLDAVDAFGRTPLMWAAFAGHTGAVRHLMRRGADVAAANCAGNTAADCACSPRDELLLLSAAAGRATNLEDVTADTSTTVEVSK